MFVENILVIFLVWVPLAAWLCCLVHRNEGAIWNLFCDQYDPDVHMHCHPRIDNDVWRVHVSLVTEESRRISTIAFQNSDANLNKTKQLNQKSAKAFLEINVNCVNWNIFFMKSVRSETRIFVSNPLIVIHQTKPSAAWKEPHDELRSLVSTVCTSQSAEFTNGEFSKTDLTCDHQRPWSSLSVVSHSLRNANRLPGL